MKKLIYILPVLALFAVLVGFGISQGDPNADSSPSLSNEVWNAGVVSDTTPPAGFPYATQWNFNCATVPNLNAGTVGACYLFGQYYFNRWNLTDCYILPNTGTNSAPSTVGMRTVPYTGQIRDMTTDGRYLYGGKASSVLYKLDTNASLITQFSLTGVIRAITYDPNRKAFWYCDFGGAVSCRDTINTLKGTFTSTQTGKYGLGFDSTTTGTNDSGFVYVWAQGTGTNILERWYVTPSVPVLKNTWTFTLPPGGVGIAGGAEIMDDNSVTPARKMLILNYQNYAVIGYKLRDFITAINNTNEIVREYALNQNYPNPFNPVTNISFVLSSAGYVELDLFNAVGEKVKTIYSGHKGAGKHEYVFDASNLASGVYYYQITVGDFRDTRKMMLVK